MCGKIGREIERIQRERSGSDDCTTEHHKKNNNHNEVDIEHRFRAKQLRSTMYRGRIRYLGTEYTFVTCPQVGQCVGSR